VRHEIVALLDHIPEALLVSLVPMLRAIADAEVAEDTLRELRLKASEDVDEELWADLPIRERIYAWSYPPPMEVPRASEGSAQTEE
jgi:hypothetical protein